MRNLCSETRARQPETSPNEAALRAAYVHSNGSWAADVRHAHALPVIGPEDVMLVTGLGVSLNSVAVMARQLVGDLLADRLELETLSSFSEAA